MYLLSEYIQKNHPERVIFSGEGSDEIFGGYLYFHKAPSDRDFVEESYRLVDELPYFDVLRADRCTSSFGLELRVPFLDKDLVNYCLSLSANIRKPKNGVEKWILRNSFDGKDYLPTDILWRQKEAFSDGVGGLQKPFYKHIQEKIDKKENVDDDDNERLYYFMIYHSYYKYEPITHYWMPKWVNVNNPSAREIQI